MLIILCVLLSLNGCARKENEIIDKVGKSDIQSTNIPYSLRENMSFVTNSGMIEKMYGKPQVIRKLPEKTYEIRDMADGSKLFVNYNNRTNGVTDIWRLKNLLTRQNFRDIHKGKSTLKDIKNIDPYTTIIETSKGNGLSEHRLKNNEIVIINYKKNKVDWVVEDIKYVNPDPSGFTTTITADDLLLIS